MYKVKLSGYYAWLRRLGERMVRIYQAHGMRNVYDFPSPSPQPG